LALALWAPFWGTPALAARKALLVGVERYKNEAHNLEGVASDVKLFKEVLIKRAGIAEKEIKILLDNEATKQNVVKSFKEWLIDGTSPGDTALFYFSGHGIQVWDENADEVQDGRDEALMCHDSNVLKDRVQRSYRDIPGLAYEFKDTQNVLLDDEIHDLLTQMKGRKVIFMSDSCHAGTVYKALNSQLAQTKNWEQPASFKGILDRRVAEPVTRAVARKKTGLGSDLMVKELRMAAFTASEDSQPAQVVPFNDREPKGKHSVFTWYLYHGLNGAADLNKDGKITFEELAKYLGEEVKRGGYAQVPQQEFQPESLAGEAFGTEIPRSEEKFEGTARIGCLLDVQTGILPAEADQTRTVLGRNIPSLLWTNDKNRISARVALEKRGGTYLAQISDATGAVWEKQQGGSLDQALTGIAGNLKAYYIQSCASAFRNPAARMDFHFNYEVKSKAGRAAGEVVKGDGLVLNAAVKSPGYLYVFTVDAAGIIHPIYPMAGSKPARLEPGRPLSIGADGSISIQEPFGREMIFAFLLSSPSAAFDSYWQKDDIGDSRDPGMVEQSRFIDTLRRELISHDRPKGQWGQQLLLLRSFQR